MTRKDIAEQLATKLGLTNIAAARSVNGVFDIITGALSNGEKVYLRGFATIDVVERKGHIGHDFSTGKPMQLPSRKALRIDAGKRMNELLNK